MIRRSLLSPGACVRAALLVCCLGTPLLLTGTAPAQQPPAAVPGGPPFDPNAVLSTLKDLKAKQAGIINQEMAGVLTKINAAIADPGKAYEQATLAVDFQGNGTNEGGRANDWRRKNAAQLRDHDFLEAVRLHLTYLALTWQHSMGMKIRDQIPALLNYTAQVGNAGDNLQPFEQLNKPVNQGLFAVYFQVGPFLKHSEDWEDQPFEVDSIYRRTILPQLRADKDARILDYWNYRIQTEAARANATQNALAVNRSRSVRLPALYWSRAEDEQGLGMTNQAVADMMALIKAHPDHPDFDRWVNKLTEIVTPAAPPTGEVSVRSVPTTP